MLSLIELMSTTTVKTQLISCEGSDCDDEIKSNDEVNVEEKELLIPVDKSSSFVLLKIFLFVFFLIIFVIFGKIAIDNLL